ncbi:GntR family transcriptional regulator [Streptomyces sp. NPDC090022]|uniref:GntR family transcriptional regulator n=1 Tax=Streptomyces sp. NPDC090022 TaxID=3365920 RepID=UPI0038083DFC
MRENRPVTSTNLRISLDASAAAAPYEQLRAQIADQARSGRLPAGFKLPTVRGLAQELGLAVNTVAKAYRALEADGVIETRGRHGTFVAAAGDAAAREAAAAAQDFADRAHRLGLTLDEAGAVAMEALRARYGRP